MKAAKPESLTLERKYRLFFGEDREGLYVADPSGKIVKANLSLARMLGYGSATDLKGLSIPSLQQRGSRWDLVIGKLGESAEPVRFEARLRRKDGGALSVLTAVSAAKKAAGQLLLVQGVVYDVSEFAQPEKAIAIFEDGFDTAFRSNPLPMGISTLADGAILEVNDSFLTVFGYSREEVAGRTSCDLHIWRDSRDRLELVEELKRCWKVRNREITLLRKDGQIIHGLWSAEIIHTPSGPCILSVINDLSERMSLQAEINNAAAEWDLTFDTIDTLIIVVGMDRFVKRINKAAAEHFGVGSIEMANRPVHGLHGSALWLKATELIDQAIDQKGPVPPCQLRENPGNRVWDISVTASPCRDAAGGRVIVTARDITGIADLRDSLRRSETMSTLGTLVAGVAHEVRNPLFSISATLDAFDINYGEREEYREYIDALQSQVERLSQLMRDLLEYGRPNHLYISEGSIGDILTSAIKTCKELAADSSVQVVKHDNTTGILAMDQARVAQVFSNILANAIQFSPKGGSVKITAEEVFQDDRLWIKCVVEDQGPGFRQEDIGRVFEPFFTRRRGGTGLGLAIVQRIIDEHGGAIFASNGHLGGACVTVLLPAALQAGATGEVNDKG